MLETDVGGHLAPADGVAGACRQPARHAVDGLVQEDAARLFVQGVIDGIERRRPVQGQCQDRPVAADIQVLVVAIAHICIQLMTEKLVS